MAPNSAPPVIAIEPEYCPQAVIDWYHISGSEDYHKQCGRRKDLSLKAKKHLRFLGWEFWYIDKKSRWELRYTSPVNGKNYISLRRACKSCIEDGGCDPQNLPLINEFETITNPLSSVNDNGSSDSFPKPEKEPRTCNESQRNEEQSHTEGSNKGGRNEVQSDSEASGKRGRNEEQSDSEASGKRGRNEEQSHLKESTSSKRGMVIRIRLPSRKRDEPESFESSSRNPRTLISRLIDEKAVVLNSKVLCRGGNNVVKRGTIMRCGIACDCCGLVFSLTRFEAHAGNTKHRPSATIFLEEDGRSLMDCLREASTAEPKKMLGEIHTSKYENDTMCYVCHDVGDLILCDRCPCSFHLTCLGLQQVPDGDWFCPPCSCRICNQPRCGEDEMDNCILVCDQCERKYHLRCLKVRSFIQLEDRPNQNWFCSVDCENMFFYLQKLIGKPVLVGQDNLNWILLKNLASEPDDGLEGLSQYKSKLSVALGLLQECFDPVIDNILGREVTKDVIFSRASEIDRYNFRGFYTVVLERNDEVISVATVRIHGRKVAEVPFVATRSGFRRLGMCRILMNEIEKQLIQLGVERMVLPSAKHVIETWTNSFGFERMTPSVKSQIVDFKLLEFQDSIMCHKSLMKP